MGKHLRVLVVDDSPDDVLLIIRALKNGGWDAEYERVETAVAMQAALLEKSWDIVICDYLMPEFDGLAAIVLFEEMALDIPLFVVSGAIGEETAVACLRAGADDCVMKSNLARLAPAVEREIREAQTRGRCRQAEVALRESEEKYRSLFDHILDAILLAGPDGAILDANPAACEMFGCSREDICSAGPGFLIDHTDPCLQETLRECLATGRKISELTMLRANGEKFPAEVASALFVDSTGQRKTSMIIRDVTRRECEKAKEEELHQRLLQSQKMEAVGQLAGGVAHDFNNMLAVILGYTELAMDKVEPGRSLRGDLREIRKAAEHSADLTRQLLAFARKQTISPRVVDLNVAIAGVLKMLLRLIGENVELNFHPEPVLWTVSMDPGQIDQIMANLCVNARDAIAAVGKITIETANVTIDPAACVHHPGFVPGDYARISVQDSGCGMDREVLNRIFEPFFTTKEPGRGTGLGLATVYGIVKQNNGFVYVDSYLDQGSTFNIYLPRFTGKAEEPRIQEEKKCPRRGHETVLLVEDESALLNLCRTVLEAEGYKVLTAGSPKEALRVAGEYDGEIDLLMTDVILPEMNGYELAVQIVSHHPGIKRLFSSGYTADVLARYGTPGEEGHFLAKPFSRNGLLEKVRETLGQE